jgi:hypothetical protein
METNASAGTARAVHQQLGLCSVALPAQPPGTQSDKAAAGEYAGLSFSLLDINTCIEWFAFWLRLQFRFTDLLGNAACLLYTPCLCSTCTDA